MGQIRINELGRELEIKSKLILEYLAEIGVAEKKSHSSSIEDEIADKVRGHFRAVEAAEEKAAREKTEAKAAAERVAAERAAAERAAAERAAAERAAAEQAAAEAALLPAIPVVEPPPGPVVPRAPAPGGARTIAQPVAAAPAEARRVAPRPRAGAPEAAARRPAAVRPTAAPTAPAAPEPGKPIYERKAPTRRRPAGATHLEKKFAEGERKVKHPVRPRLRRGPEERKVAVPVREAPVVRREHIEINVTEGITVKELAEKLEVRAKDLIKALLDRGMLATINQSLDTKLAGEIAEAFNATAAIISFEQESLQDVLKEEKVAGKKAERAPVVTVMGHVDHGKTSLLDAIRETNVIAEEAGGITQHIGAYQVDVDDRKITFIDTPGHQAFTRMRARGAKVTDLVVLVVAADDGVMPQTLEAIDHAKAAGVPLVVAINKIDKGGALPERVKKQLADRGLMPEDWGGDTVMVEVSAKKKTNLNQLLEMILLVADLQELKATPTRPASGAVLESKLDRGRGPVATVLVQDGTLRLGDPFIVGPIFGKVRALFDDRGQAMEEAGPATPVEVLGLSGVPEAGDPFQVVSDEIKAKQVAAYREQKQRVAALGASARLTLDQLHEQLQSGEVKELPLILKADVQGSVEALTDQLEKLSTDKVRMKIIHSGVGGISETDVLLASASNAVIIGFNVRPERKAAEVAQQEGVDIRHHSIIYEVLEEMEKAMAGLLEPTVKETLVGRAEVRETFRIPRVGMVAGCYVQDGKMVRDSDVRVLRDNVVIYQSKIASLRRFKEDVKEVASGYECGLTIANFADVKVGDVLEVFVVERVPSPVSA
ncbi:MAG TPA: translation initiation factor IF-2 [Candidatus Acidoferrales bacterium]|nr:translation initiation factor IF-2 [Candidatus Acidoferrales bacterium]